MNKSILVIGLGSMGKRRIRCLIALGYTKITGFDIREDRRLECQRLFGIITTDNFQKLVKKNQFDTWFISVPPDIHHVYMKAAVINKTPSFIEASVVDTEINKILKDANNLNVFLAPSCTMYFHPAIKIIFEIFKKKSLGTISTFIYHSGQYLPDWHTYESVSDYYVSQKETGGAREIVPFELTWLTQLLGFPKRVAGFYQKTIEIEGAEEIDDTYMMLMDYSNYLVNITVDVVSRTASRRLTINGSKGQLIWNWDEAVIKVYDSDQDDWSLINYKQRASANGYNENISEDMYIEEVDLFLKAVFNGDKWPNSLKHDLKVLQLLYSLEESSNKSEIITIKL